MSQVQLTAKGVVDEGMLIELIVSVFCGFLTGCGGREASDGAGKGGQGRSGEAEGR